jgi:CRP/FNR family transcriptional regulator, cyclic AMP receptor protein
VTRPTRCTWSPPAASLATGETVTLRILGPGDYFGELALIRRESRRTATVAALEPARTLSLTASVFSRLCREHPTVEHAMTTLLAERVEALSQSLLEALHVGLDRRVHRRLVELAHTYSDGADGTARSAVSIPLTQAQLADLTGGTRPSVNQVLQRLEAEGLVALRRGRIEVLDRPALLRRQDHV